MNLIEIEVIKWDQYNPRTDRKKHSWFRLENSIATEPKFFGMSAAQKFIAICLFAEVSKHSGAATQINVDWLADQLKIKPKEIIETIQHLAKRGVVRLPGGDDSGLPAVTAGHTTYERTNERTYKVAPLPGIALSWNEEIKNLKKIKKVSDKRAAVIKKHESDYTDDEWRLIFRQADRSKFLCGGGSRGWVASFDWVLRNASRVEEGEFEGPVEEMGASSMRGAS